MALANYDRETEGRPLLEPTRKPRKATDQKTQSRYKLMQTEFRACPLDKVVEEAVFKRWHALGIIQCRLVREIGTSRAQISRIENREANPT